MAAIEHRHDLDDRQAHPIMDSGTGESHAQDTGPKARRIEGVRSRTQAAPQARMRLPAAASSYEVIIRRRPSSSQNCRRTKHLPGARDRRHVTLSRAGRRRGVRDADRQCGQASPQSGRELGHAHDLLAADVAHQARRPTQQGGPQPDRHVRGIEVRAQRRAVAGNADRPAGQQVGNEARHREVAVERQIVRAHEREGPHDPETNCMRRRMGMAEPLGFALALAIGRPGLRQRRRTREILVELDVSSGWRP